MSTSQVDPSLVSSEQVYELAPVLGDRWQMSWTFTAIVGWFAVVFLLINHTPLSLEHTWSHANVGKHLLQNGVLETSLARVPLADGMPVIAESWLFDVIVSAVADRWGPNALSALIALLASAAMWSWCGLIYRVSRSQLLTLVVAIVLAIGWASHYASLQPQLVAILLLSAVAWAILPGATVGPDCR